MCTCPLSKVDIEICSHSCNYILLKEIFLHNFLMCVVTEKKWTFLLLFDPHAAEFGAGKRHSKICPFLHMIS